MLASRMHHKCNVPSGKEWISNNIDGRGEDCHWGFTHKELIMQFDSFFSPKKNENKFIKKLKINDYQMPSNERESIASLIDNKILFFFVNLIFSIKHKKIK